jgi:hypothetical protein
MFSLARGTTTMSLSSTVQSTATGATAGPVGALAGFIGSILPSLGSKYTKATFVQRFVAAMQAGDDRTAGMLVDQAVYHGWIQGVADAATWQGLLASCYSQANAKWKNYIELRLSGAPAQYDLVGSVVAQPTSIGGITPNASPTTSNPIGTAISNFLGLPQTANQAAQAGGQAAGSAISKGIITAALIVGAVVLVVVLVRVLRK